MVPIDDAAIRHSIETSQRRQSLARERRARQRKRLLLGAAAVVVIVPLGLLAGVATARAPEPPLLVLNWPKPKATQTLASGQAVVNRDGEPLDLSITHSQSWDAEWRSSQSENLGESVHWLPIGNDELMRVTCKPRVSGLGKLSAMFWTKPELTVRAIEPKRSGDYVRSMDAGEEGAWLYPFIYAQGPSEWDERALPLLATTSELLPAAKLESSLAGTRDRPSPAVWKIVNDFADKADKPAGDGSTFATITSPDVENLMPRIGRAILKASPEASVKFVVRLDLKPERGTIRLAFDGKKEHRAWIRRPGQKAGGPLLNWEEWKEPDVPPLPPGLPPG